jgi:hypothetical protein
MYKKKYVIPMTMNTAKVNGNHKQPPTVKISPTTTFISPHVLFTLPYSDAAMMELSIL